MVIAAADALVCKSGSLNIEAAIIGTPQVVLYKLSRLTWWVATKVLRMAKPSFISPVNLLAEKCVVPELLQDEATAEAIAEQVFLIFESATRRKQYADAYQAVKKQLGQPGVLSRVAQDILEHLDKNLKENN